MKLITQLKSSKILCLDKVEQFTVTVAENAHYRWLSFGDVIQSVMLKRNANLLTLPHQVALCLPLLWFQPKTIAELGLGGGNFRRFIRSVAPKTQVISIEPEQKIIELFLEYFNPENNTHSIINQPAEKYLTEPSGQSHEWLINDVYPNKKVLDIVLENAVIMKNNLNVISINLPNFSVVEIEQVLQRLIPLKNTFDIRYFEIPQYSNMIIHLVAKDILARRVFNPDLRDYQQKRWLSLWQEGIKL